MILCIVSGIDSQQVFSAPQITLSDTIHGNSTSIKKNYSNLTVNKIGSQPIVVPFPDSEDFGVVHIDSSKSLNLEIQNWGEDSLQYRIVHRFPVFMLSDSIIRPYPHSAPIVSIGFYPDSTKIYLDTLVFICERGGYPTFRVPLRGIGGIPRLSLLDNTIEFGPVLVDSSSVQRRLPIKNAGQYPLFISNVSGITGHDTSIFLLSDTMGTAPGDDSANIFITFRPDSAISFRDTITVRFLLSPDSIRRVFLHGTGVVPNVTIAPFNPINFGFIRWGSSKTINLRINNTGDGPLSIGNFISTFGSIGGGSFTYDTVGTTINPTYGYTLPLTIAPPDSEGLYSFDFGFHTTDPDSLIPQTTIYFQVVPPLITVSDSVCRFDTVAIGSSRLCTLRVINNDTASQTVSLTSLTFSHSIFSAGLSLPRTISARETLRVLIRFTPTSGMSDTGFAYFNYSTPAAVPDTIKLYGTGRGAEISSTVTSYQFPDVTTGDSSVWYLGVQNIGADTLRITGVSRTVSAFYVRDTIKTIVPGGRDSLRVCFRPAENKGYEDTLHILSNAGQKPNFPVYVVGNAGKNFEPVVTSSPPDTILEDSLMQYQVQVYDRDGDARTFSLVSGPTSRGLRLDSTTGLVTWRPLQADIGAYTISIRVRDAAAASDTQQFALTVKNVNDSPVFMTIPDSSAVADSMYYYRIKAYDEDGDTVRFYLMAAPNSPSRMTLNVISRDSAVISWTPHRSQTGLNPVVIQLQDGKGGITTKTYTIRVTSSNFRPVFVVLVDTSGVEGMLFRRQLSASDRNNDPLRYHLLQVPAGLSVDSVSGIIQWVPNEPYLGNQRLRFYVSDGLGGYDTTQFYINALNVNDSPVLQQVADTLIYDNSTFRYNLRATDEDSGSVLRYYSSSSLFRADSVTGLVSCTPHRADSGIYTVQFRVSDGIVTTSITWRVTVMHVNAPPAIVIIANDTVLEGTRWTHQVLASDEESGLNLTYQDDTPLFDINSTNGLISFTPASQNIGTHAIRIFVSDGINTSTASFLLTVLHVNHPPSIQILQDTTVFEDQRLQMRVSAADPDSNTQLRFRDNTPLFTIDSLTGGIDFTPVKADTGRHRITVYVTDGLLSDSTSFRITVVPVNHPPVIADIGNQVAWCDSLFSLKITATDKEAETILTFSDSSPLFVIDPQTGLIQFKPTLLQIGTYPVSVFVSGGTLSDTLSFTLWIRPSNHPPAILPLTDTTAIEDTPFRRDIYAADPDSGDVLKFYDNSTNFTIDSLSGVLQFIPVKRDTGLHRITVWVTDGFARDSSTFSLYVQSVNHPPSISSFPETLAYEGQPYHYQVKAVDPDNNSLLYELIQGPRGMQLDSQTGLLTWTPSGNQAGEYTIEFRVLDRVGGRITQRYILPVNHVNFPPGIVNFPALQFFEDDSLILDLTPFAYDPDNADSTLFWSVRNLKFVMARMVGRTVHFTAPKDWYGKDTVLFIVKDPEGAADTLKTIIRVIGVNEPPRVTQDTVKISFNQDDSLLVDMKPWAVDPDSDRMFWQLSASLVINSHIDSVRNMLKLTTSPHFAGTVMLRAIVSDSVGFRDTCWVKIMVSAKNLPPLILSAHPVRDSVFIDKRGTIDFGVLAVDPEGDAFQRFWLVDGIPRGIDSVFRYIPPSGFEGIQEVKVVIFDGKNTIERKWSVVTGPVSSVTLEYFTVRESNEQGICLKWSVTGSENTLFNVYRSRSQSGDFKLITSRPVDAVDPIKGLYQWYDRDVSAGEIYYYLLESVDEKGASSLFGPLTGMVNTPSEWDLGQNYPNPFNSNTRIPFRVPYTTHIKLSLYDIRGRLVRVIINEKKSPGYYSVEWDGKNSYGIPVASGVYIVQIIGDKFQKSKKIVLIR